MQTADILLFNAHILTMDEEMRQFPSGAIVIKGDSVVAVGEESRIRREYQAAQSADCESKILMPGLVNAHTHVPMTLLRGL
ncbi:MAG: amidohydrolase, partial [Anaerolineae bacterium]